MSVSHRRIFCFFFFLFVSGFATLHCHHWRACCCSRHCTVVVCSFHCLQALNFPHTQLQMPLNGKWCNFHFIVVFVVIPLLLFASCNWSVLPAATPKHNKYDQRRHCERDLPIELSWAELIRQTGTCAIYFPFWMAGIYLLPRFNFCVFIFLVFFVLPALFRVLWRQHFQQFSSLFSLTMPFKSFQFVSI